MDDSSRVADLARQLARALEEIALLHEEREIVIDELLYAQETIKELRQQMGLQSPLLHD